MITTELRMTCPQCKGSRSYPPYMRQVCSLCQGTGSVSQMTYTHYLSSTQGVVPCHQKN